MNINDLKIEFIHIDKKRIHVAMLKQKCQKLLDHSESIIDFRVELIRDTHSRSHKNEFIAKGHLNFKGKHSVVSSASDDILKSIDLLVHKMDRVLRRKSRIEKFKRHLNIFK
jgi:putative sigma-54 modulation protein